MRDQAATPPPRWVALGRREGIEAAGPPMPPENPSYRDIARKAGVSPMTVSLALRNSPRISTATRARVRRISEQLGYSSDPRVSEMMRYLRARRTARERPVLAMVNAREAPVARLRRPYAVGIARSAAIEAERLGYRIEEFWLGKAELTDRRLSSILEARGIRGVLLLPLPPGRTEVDLRWDSFSAVSTCYLSYGIGLNQVSTNRQHYIEMALDRVKRLGYRRIGLAIDEDMDERSHHQTLAQFLWDQSRQPRANRVRPLCAPALDRATVAGWMRAERPDVVISPRNHVHGLMTELGCRIPGEIGFVSLAASAGDVPGVTGVDERPGRVGVAAVDFLVAQVERGEFGIPKIRQLVLVEGAWIHGRTVRPGPGGESALA